MKINKEKIIGYYDYFYDQYEYSKVNSKLIVNKEPNDMRSFFHDVSTCPFCGTKTKLSFVGSRSATIGTELHFSGDVYECSTCKWWAYVTTFSDGDDCIDVVNSANTQSKYSAITKSYTIDDKNIPINILSEELKKRPQLIYDITPYKLEELAQSVLKGVFNCEVHHVGKTGDGGTDLIVLDSDSPILVQVKRREKPSHIELVKGVREFLGTLFIENEKKGIYISTAKRFSKGSKQVTEKLLNDRRLEYFELVDFDKLSSLIKDVPEDRPWERLVEEFYSDKSAIICDAQDDIDSYLREIASIEKRVNRS